MELPEPFTREPNRYGQCIFTRAEAVGALSNGTMIRKIDFEDGDRNPVGTIGEIIGSCPAEPPSPEALKRLPARFHGARHVYFVEWAGTPNAVVAVIDKKIEEVT